MSVKDPWACFMWNKRDRRWVFKGRRRARRPAMNLVDRPYASGWAKVVNDNTGERWERIRGSWFKKESAGAPPRKAAAQ